MENILLLVVMGLSSLLFVGLVNAIRSIYCYIKYSKSRLYDGYEDLHPKDAYQILSMRYIKDALWYVGIGAVISMVINILIHLGVF